MCGFIVTNSEIPSDYDICSLLKHRGPDHTTQETHNNIKFMHTLLSLTGDFTPQPISGSGISVLFNGEIYNYKDLGDYESDVYAIFHTYQKYGEQFLNYLDGEFAIVLYDSNNEKVYFAVDIFGTKPLYYSLSDNGFGLASYKKALEEIELNNIQKMHANSFGVIDLKTHSLEIKTNYHEFNLDQYKNSYDDWNKAFVKAVDKRFSNLNQDIILPLSSGLDSGGIACAFEILDINHEIFSFYGNENKRILFRRIFREYFNKRKIHIKKSMKNSDLAASKAILKDKIPNFYYGTIQEEGFLTHDGFNDRASYGLVHILNFVKKRNPKIKILASGQGGDEITSNQQAYTWGDPNPEYFDDNLESVFPWENFYHGTQSSYLMKEESITGGFGIEGRYPYLDTKVVQEYLNLTPELKNKHFKAPIYNFLVEHNYPVLKNNSVKHKKGFNIIKENLIQKFISFVHKKFIKR